MRIAVTFQNKKEITGHAGKTSRFLIYNIDNASNKVIEKDLIELEKEDILHNRFHNSAEPYAPHPIYTTDVLITAGAGYGFVNRLSTQNVNVIITSEQDPDMAVALFLKGELPIGAPHHHINSN